MGPLELSRGLLDGQALEVAEDNRQAEGNRQPPDLVVQAPALGLALQGHEWTIGSTGGTSQHTSGCVIEPPSSRWRRLTSRILAFRAVRSVTPYSQFPSSSGSRIDRALRARMRKTAWNTSSAWCRSPTSWWQMPRTMGPCRVTSAANAASPAGSRRAMNRSRSCRSVRPATELPSKRDSICRKTDPVAAYAMPLGSLADTSVQRLQSPPAPKYCGCPC